MSTLPFGTQAWLDRFQQELNAWPEYRAAAKHWNDDACYVIDPDPDVGFEEPVGYYMRWVKGEVVEARAVSSPDDVRAVFRLRGAYSDWAEVHRSRLDGAVALLVGKFKFEGPFAKAAANVVGETMMLKKACELATGFLDPIAR